MIILSTEETSLKLLFLGNKVAKGLFPEKVTINLQIIIPDSRHVMIMDGRRSSVRLILILILNIRSEDNFS